jgi:hypothetical protein
MNTTAQTKSALRRQFDLQVKICERAEKEIKGLVEQVNRTSLLMDLDSVPELDLDKLLHAPKFDFAHDICGIIRHMDRSSYPGKLTNCFWPRCAEQM